MSKAFTKSNKINIISLNPKQKIINIRKPINKIMNLDNFLSKNKISKSPKVVSKNSIYYCKKSYISPTIASLTNHNSNKNIKKISPSSLLSSINSKTNKYKSPNYNSKISPIKQKYNFLQNNIKNQLYIQRNNNNKNIPKYKTDNHHNYAFHHKNKNEKIKNDTKKNNYKNKIISNKEKISKNIDNNIIFNSLIDFDSSENNFNNSIQGKEKIKQYINENKNEDNIIKCDINKDIEINKDEFNILLNNNDSGKKGDNLINSTNAFDVGSISNISKNGSNSVKEKNIEDENKTNNKEFENIINDLIEEENCKNLFKENKKNNEKNEDNDDDINDIIKENIEKNIIDDEFQKVIVSSQENQDNEENEENKDKVGNKENEKNEENSQDYEVEIIELNKKKNKEDNKINNNKEIEENKFNNKSEEILKNDSNINNSNINNSNNIDISLNNEIIDNNKFIINNSKNNMENTNNNIIKENTKIDKNDILSKNENNNNENYTSSEHINSEIIINDIQYKSKSIKNLIKAVEISNVLNINNNNNPFNNHITIKEGNTFKEISKEFNNILEYQKLKKNKTQKSTITIEEDNISNKVNIKTYINKSYKNVSKKSKNENITNAVYNKKDNNNNNEEMSKLNNSKKISKYKYTNIVITHPIIISINNGIFYINGNSEIESSDLNKDKQNEYNDEEMEIFISNKNKNLSFQKNEHYTFHGTV